MDTVTSSCDEAALERLLSGTLENDRLVAVERHLDDCPRCRDQLDRLAALPGEWEEVRARLAEPPTDTGADGGAWSDPRAILGYLNPTDDPEMLGRLGPYEVKGVVGAGGMGVVLKGWDRTLNRFVAIKLLAPHLATSDTARRRFMREARAAAAVVHENVVAIHGVAEANGLPYLVMPFFGGTTLERRLREAGPLDPVAILRIALQTARGLAEAHAQGLVHRDVKPANILLDEGVERVLLTDFGLARAADDAGLTRTGFLAGTPQYMSPEQAKAQPVDARSDLFSLGSVMYAMCTGQPPFRAESSYAVLRLITDHEPTPIREINPDVPEWLCRLVAQLMAKEPAERFASATEVAGLLEACLAHAQQPEITPLPGELLAPPEPAPARPSERRVPVRKLLTYGGLLMGMTVAVVAAVVCLAPGVEIPPDLSGKWHGEGWGQVTLTSVNPGEYRGTFTESVTRAKGTLELRWSRVERRFNGTWHEGEDRFGELSLRLDGEIIRGALTTDARSKVNPATPKLADLTWRRGALTETDPGEKRDPLARPPGRAGFQVVPVFVPTDAVERIKKLPGITDGEKERLVRFVTDAFRSRPPVKNGVRQSSVDLDADATAAGLKALHEVLAVGKARTFDGPDTADGESVHQVSIAPPGPSDGMPTRWEFRNRSAKRPGEQVSPACRLSAERNSGSDDEVRATFLLEPGRAAVLPWLFHPFDSDLSNDYQKKHGGELFLVFTGLAPAASGRDPAVEPTGEHEPWQGVWLVSHAEKEGKVRGAADRWGLKSITIRGDRITLSAIHPDSETAVAADGGTIEFCPEIGKLDGILRGRFTINALIPSHGGYELDGNNLTLRFDPRSDDPLAKGPATVYRLRRVSAVSFVERQTIAGRAELTMKYFTRGHLTRIEVKGDSVQDTVMILDTRSKTRWTLIRPDGGPARFDRTGPVPSESPIDYLLALRDRPPESIGEERLGGKLLRKVTIKGEPVGVWVLWIDPKTELPVRITKTGTASTVQGKLRLQTVYEDFDWNPMLQDRLFDPSIQSRGGTGPVRSLAGPTAGGSEVGPGK